MMAIGSCNVLGLFFNHAPYRGVGASGMVMGALSLMAVQSIFHWRGHPRAGRLIVSGLLGGVMLFVLLGLDPKSDVAAHLGGFVGGAVGGAMLAWIPADRLHHPVVNFFAGTLLALLFGGVWWLALR